MVHNPGGDWHPGRGDDPNYEDCSNIFYAFTICFLVSENGYLSGSTLKGFVSGAHPLLKY